MKLVLLARRDTNIGRNSGRKDFWRNMEGQRNGIWHERKYKYTY